MKFFIFRIYTMNKLEVYKNKIKDSEGKEIILKWICINSPGILIDEGHDFLNDIIEIKKLWANAVKIPICPAYRQFYKDYCSKILDPIIELTKKLELYCCLDRHAQGDPFENHTREIWNEIIHGFEKYDAKKEVAFKVLYEISKLYGKEKNIIFDIFSMPIYIDNNNWRSIAQEFVDIVRSNTTNIIIVNGTNWTSDLSRVLENPIKSNNIVYGFSYYPLEMFQDLTMVFKVNEKYPIIFSECGYTKEWYFKGTKENYWEKLKEYTSGIGFFAWAYHPKRVPIILNSWDPNDLSEWWQFLKEELLDDNMKN